MRYANEISSFVQSAKTVQYFVFQGIHDGDKVLSLIISKIIPTNVLELCLDITIEDFCKLYLCACELDQYIAHTDREDLNIVYVSNETHVKTTSFVCKVIEFLAFYLMTIDVQQDDVQQDDVQQDDVQQDDVQQDDVQQNSKATSITQYFILEYCNQKEDFEKCNSFYKALFEEQSLVNAHGTNILDNPYITIANKVKAHIGTAEYQVMKYLLSPDVPGDLFCDLFGKYSVQTVKFSQASDSDVAFKIPQASVPRKRKTDESTQSTSIHPAKVSRVAGGESLHL